MEIVVQNSLEILKELHLVKQKIILSAVLQFGIDLFADRFRLAQMNITKPVELNLNDMVVGNPLAREVFPEHLEEQIGFAATAYPCDDLYQMVALAPFQPRQIELPWYFHFTTSFFIFLTFW
jgi:hypothetical protein